MTNRSHNIFLSWSTPPSREVAAALYEWLPDVIQAADLWFSDKDIAKGQTWITQIFDALDSLKLGLFCITPGNCERAWLAFEAGAIRSKGEGMLFTYLHGVEKTDVTGPLRDFQHTVSSQEDTYELVKQINRALGSPLKADRLERAFQQRWPDLKEKLDAIDLAEPSSPVPSPEDLTRATLSRVASLGEDIRRLSDGVAHNASVLSMIQMGSRVGSLGHAAVGANPLGYVYEGPASYYNEEDGYVQIGPGAKMKTRYPVFPQVPPAGEAPPPQPPQGAAAAPPPE